MAPRLCLVEQISGCHQPHYMNYSLYLLSESFRSPGQYISLPVDWAVCNTLAVQLLTKGKVNARLPLGPTTGTCLLAHSLVSLFTAAKLSFVQTSDFLRTPISQHRMLAEAESYAYALPAVSGGQWLCGVVLGRCPPSPIDCCRMPGGTRGWGAWFVCGYNWMRCTQLKRLLFNVLQA